MAAVLLNRMSIDVPDLDEAAVRRLAAERMTRVRGGILHGLPAIRGAVDTSRWITVQHVTSGSLDSARMEAAVTRVLEDVLTRVRLVHVEAWRREAFRLPVDVERPCQHRPEDACERCVAAGAGAA